MAPGEKSMVSIEEVQRAFQQQTLSDQAIRDGTLAVPAPKITHQELKVVENALRHPPKKFDPVAGGISLLSALFFISKTLIDGGAVTTGPLIALLVAITLFAVQIIRAIDSREKHPFHDQALGYVQALTRLPDSATNIITTVRGEADKDGNEGGGKQ